MRGYASNVAAGEDIRIVPAHKWHPKPADQDFWLFDDRLYLMHYAPDGTRLDVEQVDHPSQVATALETRQEALVSALPYRDYMRRHPDLVARSEPL